MPFKLIEELSRQHICRNPEHNPPTMIVLQPGVYEYTCPGCGKSQIVRVPAIG